MIGKDTLIVIPARGGSKGIPNKNIRELAGKPLIYYTIDVAREIINEEFICVSTDDDEIIKKVKEYGLDIPFKRPIELATDNSGMYEVLQHALNFYEQRGYRFDCIILLQPTSPLRKPSHVIEAYKLFNDEIDMIVSVKESNANPYYNLYEEDENIYLRKSKQIAGLIRRQDAPKVYQLNGSIYIIRVDSIKKYKSFEEFAKIKKYLMDEQFSIDLDEPIDWAFCEYLLIKGILTKNYHDL